MSLLRFLLDSPRYKLLIQELVRNTDEKHPDFAGLTKALEDVSKVALHINEAIRSQQNRLNVIAIENQFSGKIDLVSPSRRFVKQGALTKKCRNSDKRYEFFLFNDVFMYASKVSAAAVRVSPFCVPFVFVVLTSCWWLLFVECGW